MSKEYVNPAYLYNGQTVYVSARLVNPHCKPGTGLRCVVEQAHGDAGMLVNVNYGFRKLMSRYDMYVPPKEAPNECN